VVIKLFLAIVIILAILILVPLSLNYVGVCLPKGRILSDREKIRIAAEYFNNQPAVGKRTPDRGRVSYDYIPYSSTEEFLQNNPNCCRVIFEPKGYKDILRPITFWDRASGAYRGGVEVIYNAKYVDESGKKASFQNRMYVEMGNCKIYDD
jgi:hypothetical protein